MATSAGAYAVEVDATRPPKASVVWAIALAGCVAAGFSLAAALASDAVSAELGEHPLVLASLSNWITVSYVLCGLFAWSRRPASRFGPLMIAAGVGNFLEALSWTSGDVPFTIGQTLDFLPPVLFLHLFLAFPSGRLEGWFERSLISAAYVTAIGLGLVRMAFGGFGPHNLLEFFPNPDAAQAVVRVQLLAVSASCLAGVSVLGVRSALLVTGLIILPMGLIVLGAAMPGAPAFGKASGRTSVALGLVALAAASVLLVDVSSIGAVSFFALIAFHLGLGWKVHRLCTASLPRVKADPYCRHAAREVSDPSRSPKAQLLTHSGPTWPGFPRATWNKAKAIGAVSSASRSSVNDVPTAMSN